MSVYTITYDLPIAWSEVYKASIKRAIAAMIESGDKVRYSHISLLPDVIIIGPPESIPDQSIAMVVVRISRNHWDIMVSPSDANTRRLIQEDAKSCARRAREQAEAAKVMMDAFSEVKNGAPSSE